MRANQQSRWAYRRGGSAVAATLALTALLSASLTGISLLAGSSDAATAAQNCDPSPILINTGYSQRNVLNTYSSVNGTLLSSVPLSHDYGDIALTPDNVLYGIDFGGRNQLHAIDQATGAETSSVSITGPNGVVSGGLNALTSLPNGQLLLGSNGSLSVYEVNPTTGAATVYATLPQGAASAGDFLSVVGGDVVALTTNPNGQGSAVFRIHPDGTMTEVGTVPEVYGAAQSGGKVYLAGSNGTIYSLPSVPTAASTAALPLTTLVATGLPFFGATSLGDAGLCANLQTSKSVSPTSGTAVQAGQTLTYTLTFDNSTGQAAAIVDSVDNLDGVLDDATITSAPAQTTGTGLTVSAVSGTSPRQFTITGAVAPGGTSTVTYSIRVNNPDTGDHALNNFLLPPGDPVPTSCTADNTNCTTNLVEEPSYTVQKRVSASPANPGKPITYTVTVTNTGQVAYDSNAPAGAQQASFSDDLSDVLDDATYNGDASNGATVTGTTLSWAGPLAVGQTQTITYSVTPKDPASSSDPGNLVLNNGVTPTGRGGSCVTGKCTTSTPVQALQITKVSDKTSVIPGSTINYTISVKNTGKTDYTTDSNAASFSDDLSQVLDDATYNSDASASAGSVSYSSPTLSWSGPVAAGQTVTVTYSVTVNNPDTGDSLINNTVTSTTPGSNCASGSTDPRCAANVPSSSYTVSKLASETVANPGDTVTYTVTVKNTGRTAYTTGSPASFTDDLSKVLDDATYNGDASTGATVTGTTLSWSGPLAVGATATVTYSVTVKNPDTGDKTLTNAVVPTAGGGRCAAAADCTTTTTVRSYAVQKKASTGTVTPGGQVTYTVTVTNTGTADYTTATPATFTDDLSKVADDATVNTPLPAGATLSADGKTLTWSGPLAVGATQEVTYTVTVGTPDTGDHVLTNAVTPTAPGGGCATAGGCTTTTPVLAYTVTKQASAATITPGAELTYTVTVTNTGGAAYTTDQPASFTDDLSKVIDDATFDGATLRSSDGGDAGVVDFTSPELTWTGPLALGGTVTVTYTVTVNTPDTGDHVLTNAVDPTGPGGSCATTGACTTNTAVQSITFTKVADTDKVVPGDEVTYTITVTNTGQVAYTDASFTDDLTGVLDDATYNGDAAATAGTTSYNAPTLSWTGPAPVGGTVTVTYSVTVKNPDTGDKILDNTVVSNSPGSGCTANGTDPGCRSVVPAGSYTVAKIASSSTATQGSTITYTVTVTNTGKTAYTSARPASFQDNLIQVLDDATYNGDATATAGTTAYQRPNLTWSGPLPIGASVTVTYSVTVNTPDTGDRNVINAVAPTGPGGACATATACTTTTSVPPGFAVHTGGAAAAAEPGWTGWWMALTGAGIAALLGSAVIWLRRRRTIG